MRRLASGSILIGLCLALAGQAHAQHATSLDRCISAIAGDALRYVDKAGKCVRKCEDAKRRGQLGSDVRCKRPSNHPPTQSCLLAAFEGFAGSKSNALKRCTDGEIALFYGNTSTCPGKNDTLPKLLQCLARRSESAVEGLAKKIYRPQHPPVCGDGAVNGSEQCDPGASPTGCSYPYDVCHPQGCYCTFSGCGNGILESGEDCDYYATPNGCSFYEYCGYDCACRGSTSPSQAFLSESSDLLR